MAHQSIVHGGIGFSTALIDLTAVILPYWKGWCRNLKSTCHICPSRVHSSMPSTGTKTRLKIVVREWESHRAGLSYTWNDEAFPLLCLPRASLRMHYHLKRRWRGCHSHASFRRPIWWYHVARINLRGRSAGDLWFPKGSIKSSTKHKESTILQGVRIPSVLMCREARGTFPRGRKEVDTQVSIDICT